VIHWTPVRFVDRFGGAALNVLALAIVTWIVASAMATLPETTLSQAVRQSQVLVGLDRLVPDQARNFFIGVRDLVRQSGMPRAFAGLAEVLGPEVSEPDPALLDRRAVREAWEGLVKVGGVAPRCDAQVSGSGFIYAPERVMTNAHVVAGVESPIVQLRGTGTVYPARVIAFDPELDVAILLVPDLPGEPLRWANRPAASGDPAVIAGFPGGGRLDAQPARIRTEVTARGEDIYGRAGVFRDIYSFRGQVVPGNSGGPLLSRQGRVLGMIFAAAVGDRSTGYALTAEQLSEAAEAGRSSTTRVDSGPCRTS
jgi:S1-C subfamily serine protease